jgi:hypothetical protein
MTNVCKPADDAVWWSHHWIGPKDGDIEPWLWTDSGDWTRGNQLFGSAEMAQRGWVYVAPCELPEAIKALRDELQALRRKTGNVVVPIR